MLLSTSSELRIILEVVKSVAVPPRIVPKASGIKTRERLTSAFRAAPETAGSKTAAAAMLFIKSDRNAPAIITIMTRRSSLLPPTLSRIFPTCSVTPLRRNASAMIKIARIVITAERENPENASCGVKTPETPSATTTSKATRSAGILSVKNKISATIRTEKVITS